MSENKRLKEFKLHPRSSFTEPYIALPLTNHLVRQLASYWLLLKDLNMAKIAFQKCDLLVRQDCELSQDQVFELTSFSIAGSVTYVKCFSSSRGGKSPAPVRLSKNDIPKNWLEVHDEIKNIRDEYFVHPESVGGLENASVLLLLHDPSDRKGIKTFGSQTSYITSFPGKHYEEFVELIHLLKGIINNKKMPKCIESLTAEYEIHGIDELYKMAQYPPLNE